ncbi:zinc finger protein [Cinnamomum micranthum f. kanehirae]|uniref:GATA transcription factor n=1 Tax=Cinnamomum micranthum f. kanehirae TaxID=337451 RepID=A0A3S3P9Q9_9MAGN|nr:zinc finger protein [Cinnamomum micranthum f. kanehirae]
MIGQGFMDDLDTDVCGDLFDHIDDLLDFPNEEIGGGGGDVGGFEGCWPTGSGALTASDSSFSAQADGGSTSSRSHSVEDDLAPLPVPCEDIAELEWLSAFMDDSFSTGSIDLDNDSLNNKDPNTHNNESSFKTSSPVSVLESSSSCSGKPMLLSPDTVVPGRARSKRPRPPSFSPRTAVTLVSPTSSDTSSDVFPATHFLPELKNFAESLPAPKKSPKKKKKFPAPAPATATEDGAEVEAAPPLHQAGAVRKCLHCEIQKTPQWRMGPLGPKTLCNACGVRYKSGRLYPEYRPAASPTFVASLHSNSHKKVLEMRVKSGDKEPAPTPEFVRKNAGHLLDCA